MRSDPPAFRDLAERLSKEPRHIVRIEFPTGSLYVTSHSDISGVPGVVLNGCLSEPSLVSQKLNPDEARAEIGSASFRLVDVGSQFTTQIRAQLADGHGLRRRRCTFFLGFAGMPFADFQVIGTQDVASATYDKGAYSVECFDVQRAARKQIFVQATTTLAATVLPSDATIYVESTAGFEPCKHGPSFTDAPGETVYYFRIKDEKIRATGKTGNSFTGCTRGVLGTVAGMYEVDASTPASRREKVTEEIYLELPGPKLLYAILTGVLYGDGFTLPTSWHLGIDPALIRTADFTGIGRDLWDTTNDANGVLLRFVGLSKIDGKKFYEEEILRLLGLFAPVYADGTLGLRKMTGVLKDAATVATLDESNCVQVGPLEHDMQSLRNVFTTQWNPSLDGKSFTRELTLLDAFSVGVHGRGEELVLAFRGLWGGRHTDATLFKLIDATRDRYAAPPVRMSVDVLHGLNRIEVGDCVRVKLKHVRDFAGPVGSIDRAFEVQSVSVNHRTGRCTLELFGSTAPASAISPTTSTTALPDGFYTSDGVALSTVLPISGGVVSGGTHTLTGFFDLNATGAIFYHAGDLTIPTGCTLNISQNVQLRVRGALTINGTINGVAGGNPGVADTNTTNQPAGNPGFLGNSRGWDGVNVSRDYEEGPPDMQTAPAQLTRGLHPVFPFLQLEVVGSTLKGLPSDLRGTGGAPGGRVTAGGVRKALGGSGAAGGAGLCIIARSISIGVAASVDLSGASSVATSVLWPVSRNSYAPGPGGAGGPGAMLILLDGTLASAPDFAGRFVANTGSVVLPTGALPPNGELLFLDNERSHRYPSNTGVWMGYKSPDVISGRSMSVAALRVQYVPAPQDATQDVTSAPPPVTGLVATAQTGSIGVDITPPSFEAFDVVELWASATNNRADASRVAEVRGTFYSHPLPGGATRYYWARTRNGLTAYGTNNVSKWYPDTTTSTVTATALAAGSGPAGDSLIVQYSADGITWHDPPWIDATDVYMRQKVGAGGTFTAAIRVRGEAGSPGSPGAAGNYVDFVFKRSATLPATPTGSIPSGWFDAPPAADGNPLYMSSGEKSAAGTLIGTWSVPVKIEGPDGPFIRLASTSTSFRVGANDQATAGAQVLTLSVQTNLPGTPSWTFTPDAGTWTGAGFSYTTGVVIASWDPAAFFAANPTAKSVRFGVTIGAYTDYVTVYKVRDGNSGTNLLDPTMWKVGTTGTQGLFQAIGGAGGDNAVVLGGQGSDPLGPTGAAEPLWRTINPDIYDGLTDDPDGGWNYDFPVDPKKTYRFAVWVRVNATGSVGSRYLGCNGCLTLAGAANSNPYWMAGSPTSLGMIANRWYLFVGFLHGTDYALSNTGLSGVYDTEGRQVYTATDFKQDPAQLTQRHRTYHYYDPVIGNKSWWARPRVDELNGSEPSLRDLLQASPITIASRLVPVLTNESHTVPADASGNVLSYAGSSGLFVVSYGGADVTSACTFSVVSNPQGLTGSPLIDSAGAYGVTGGLDAGEDAAVITFRATYVTPGGATLTADKVFTLTKSKTGTPGSNGANAKLLYLVSDRQQIVFDGTGTATPLVQTTVFTIKPQNVSANFRIALARQDGTPINAVTYIGAGGGYTDNGDGTFNQAATVFTLTIGNFEAARGSTQGVIVTVSHADGVSDSVSIVRVQNGSNGAPGAPGAPGSPGTSALSVVYPGVGRTQSGPAFSGSVSQQIGAPTILNGSGSYTYAWTKIGDIAGSVACGVDDSAIARPTFAVAGAPTGEAQASLWQVVITDASTSQVAQQLVGVRLRWQSTS